MTPPPIAVGQHWRRRADGVDVTVAGISGRCVSYIYDDGTRRGWTSVRGWTETHDGPIGPRESM